MLWTWSVLQTQMAQYYTSGIEWIETDFSSILLQCVFVDYFFFNGCNTLFFTGGIFFFFFKCFKLSNHHIKWFLKDHWLLKFLRNVSLFVSIKWKWVVIKIGCQYLLLCSAEDRLSYRFGTTWSWLNDDRICIFGWHFFFSLTESTIVLCL